MATRRYNVPVVQDDSTRYASDLNDQEFELIAPHVAQKSGSGKKRSVDIREVLNAIFYRTRTGCQWRMLPSDFPPWNQVWYYYRKWRNDGTLEDIVRLGRIRKLIYLVGAESMERLSYPSAEDLGR